MMSRLFLLVPAVAACGFVDPVTDDVGEASYCEDVAEWEGDWSELELDLIQEVNAARGLGGECDGDDIKPDVILDLAPELRCAARKQARDMARQGELGHVGSDSSEFPERAADAGYAGIPRAEILAVGFGDAPAVFDQWVTSEEHCPVVYDRDNDEVGAGVFQTQDTLW